jgi:hypothetical protein
VTSVFRPILPYFGDDLAAGRFWGRVAVGHANDCWPWKGQTNSRGYGRHEVWPNRQRVRLLAHRVAVTITSGQEIGRNVLLHACDNPPCCNPRHLRVGTQSDNMRDALTKGRANLTGLALGRQMSRVGIQRSNQVTHCKWGYEFTDANTYQAKGGRRCRACRLNNDRAAYRRTHLAAIRPDAVEAAISGEPIELGLWERRAAIDSMILRGERVCDISRTLGVPRRTINTRRANLRKNNAAKSEIRGVA